MAEGGPGEYGSWKKQHVEGGEQVNKKLPMVFLRLCYGCSPEAVRGERDTKDGMTQILLLQICCIYLNVYLDKAELQYVNNYDSVLC